MKTVTTALIAAALMGGAAAATLPAFARGADGAHCDRHAAWHRHGGMSGDIDGRIEHMARALDLGKDQLASLRAVADRQRPKLRDARDRMADAHVTLERMRRDGNPDAARLRAAADAEGKAIADMIVLKADIEAQIEGVLTPEQLAKWRAWRGHHGHRMGHMDHHGKAQT